MPKKSGKASTPALIGWAAAVLALGLGVGALLGHVSCERKQEAPKREEAVKPPHPARKSKPEPARPEPPNRETPGPVEAPSLPKLALIIDDLGYAEPDLVKRLCSEPVPLTVAVLPYQEHTVESADLAHEMGKAVILHLPMEGIPGKDPGPDALKYDLPESEVRARTRKALADVPFIEGANNHMGSRMTADARRMHWILEEFKGRKLYFVDSRTIATTQGWVVAHELGIPTIQRKVFLDDDKSFPEIQKQFERALASAQKDGEAVAIGHIYPETVDALEKLIPDAKGKVQFVFVRDLVK
ncbi:MAG: divergent polysaccharide deacetylase family protein [Acidobacteria bacterium]|nr:divergent polysaccharide deacetylase family protein [Acidobacteriota bacterium]